LLRSVTFGEIAISQKGNLVHLIVLYPPIMDSFPDPAWSVVVVVVVQRPASAVCNMKQIKALIT